MTETGMTEQEEYRIVLENIKNLKTKELLKSLAGLIVGGTATRFAISALENGVIDAKVEYKILGVLLFGASAGAYFYSGGRFTDAMHFNDEEKRLRKVAHKNRYN